MQPQIQELIWTPTPKQSAFIEIPDTVFEGMFGGAAGAGKSETLLNLPLVKEWFKHPKFKGIIFRRTYPELEAEIIARSKRDGLYAGTGGKYNEEKKRWVFPAGGMVQFGHLEYDSDVRKYDSAEYNYIGFDELTSFTEYQYRYMFSRCRSATKNLPALVRSGTNPGGVGHGWVRARFVDPAPYGTLIVDKLSGLKRIFIQAKATDNKHLMEADPSYLARLSAMGEKDRRAKLDGDWYTFGGQVFDDYRDGRFTDEPENALHVCPQFEIPSWWPKVLAIDWGYDAMTYALWGAISPNARVYLYREYSIRQAKISQWATDIGRISHKEKFDDIVLCRSAWQKRGDPEDISEQFTKYSGLTARQADNSRISGKLLLQDYFRWRVKPVRKVPEVGYNQDTANHILRNKGMDAYKDYIESFEPELPEQNLPKLQIFEGLEILRKTIPLCVYDDDNKEDVAEFPGDDPYDTLRYCIKAIDLISVDKVQNNASNLMRIDEAIRGLQSTNDQTSFYRKMEVLERKIKPARPFIKRRRVA